MIIFAAIIVDTFGLTNCVFERKAECGCTIGVNIILLDFPYFGRVYLIDKEVGWWADLVLLFWILDALLTKNLSYDKKLEPE